MRQAMINRYQSLLDHFGSSNFQLNGFHFYRPYTLKLNDRSEVEISTKEDGVIGMILLKDLRLFVYDPHPMTVSQIINKFWEFGMSQFGINKILFGRDVRCSIKDGFIILRTTKDISDHIGYIDIEDIFKIEDGLR
jgi:hypothetical protein